MGLRGLPLIEQVVALRRAGADQEALTVLLKQAQPAFVDWLAAINKLIDLEEAANKTATDNARAISDRFMWLMIGAFGAAAVLALVTAVLTARRITRPLADAVTVLGAVAAGDLTRRLDARTGDEIGQMAASMNTALQTIADIVVALGGNARNLASTSSRIGTASLRMADSAEQASASVSTDRDAANDVSSNVQTVAAGSAELRTSISEIADNAQQAARVAAQAVDSAKATSATMSTLHESSRQIGNVVKASPPSPNRPTCLP